MKLIPNWKRALRGYSVMAQGAATSVLGAWLAIPEDMRAVVPTWVVFAIVIVLLVLGIIGRLVAQPKLGL